MAQKHKSDIVNLYILIVSILIVVVAMYWTNRDGESILATSHYVSSSSQLIFDYPASLVAVDEDVSANVQVVNLYAKGRENNTSEIISITHMTTDSDLSIVDVAANYLEVDRDKIVEVKDEEPAEARYVAYNSSGEVSYYSFVKDDSRLDVVKFNQKLFDKSNPLVVRNNSFYNSAYTKVLNSLTLVTE